jgi:hypothetical protein
LAPPRKKTKGPDPGRILNYTTEIEPPQSLKEIQDLLVAHGARAISVLYGDDRRITGIGFHLPTALGERNYHMLANAASVRQRMIERHDNEVRQTYLGQAEYRFRNYLWEKYPPAALEAQAQRTAWRILKDAIAVMLNLSSAGLADSGQVFFGFGQLSDGSGSVFDAWTARAALGPATE